MEKKFVVVFLPLENIYSEMPASWLTEDREHCWWPKTLNARLFMKRGEEPDEKTWDLHKVHIEAYCSTLESARRKAEDPEFSTTSNEIEKTGRGRRKKKNINFSPSSDSSLSDDTLTPPPTPLTTKVLIHDSALSTRPNKEKKKKEHQSESKLVEHGDVIYEIPSVSYESDITTRPSSGSVEHGEIQNYTTKLQNYTSSQTPLIINEKLSSSGIETNNNIEIIIDENSLSAISSGSGGNIIAVEPSETRTAITLETLHQEIVKLRTICLSNKKFLNSIYTRVNDGFGQTNNSNPQKLKNIPLKTINEMQEFELQIEQDDNVKTSLVHLFKSLGGRDGKDHLHRCLAQLFTNELATQCSWFGQRGNFKIKDLHAIKSLTECIISSHSAMSCADIEKHAGEWFRLSRQRLNREMKKKDTRIANE